MLRDAGSAGCGCGAPRESLPPCGALAQNGANSSLAPSAVCSGPERGWEGRGRLGTTGAVSPSLTAREGGRQRAAPFSAFFQPKARRAMNEEIRFIYFYLSPREFVSPSSFPNSAVPSQPLLTASNTYSQITLLAALLFTGTLVYNKKNTDPEAQNLLFRPF